ncbi:MAG: toprim domain-containing protein [Candidatus Bathyarchaeia archaeon]
MKIKNARRTSVSDSFVEKAECLTLWFHKLTEKSSEDAVILVEGPKDLRALRSAGVGGKIFCVMGKRMSLQDSLAPFLDSDSEVIVLTDFDRSGRHLLGRISRYLSSHGKVPNLNFWVKLHGLASSDIKDIEGLVTYVQNVQNKAAL